MRIAVVTLLLLPAFASGAGGTGGVATLHVQVTGNGTVTSSPPGINCPTECADQFDSGSRVVLTAHPGAGEAFLGWGGACSGSAQTCTVVMDVEKNVAAKFTPGTLPALAIDDTTTHETNFDTDAVLTITLAPASTQTITVTYATVPGTADTTDYVAASGIATFAAGATTLRLPIEVKGDALDEPDETFFVDLFTATNATITRARGTVTIVDDDPVPFRLLDAFVDARWNVHRRYTRVMRFTIHRPSGALVNVRCRGKGCPVRVGAKLRPGAVVEVRVEMPYQPLIGRVFQYKIRAGRRPRFTASCLPPGALRPTPC